MATMTWRIWWVAALAAGLAASGCMGAADDSGYWADDDDDWGGDADADGDSGADADSDADSDGDDYVDPEVDPEQTQEEAVCESATDERVTQFMSADDSNSQAAPVVIRERIETGLGGYVGRQRLYEFLNYYSFDYEPADEGTLRIVPQLRPIEGDPTARSLLIGVVAPAIDPLHRRPLNLTFSIDASGSMSGDGIDRARAVVRAIAAELREGDFVSIVTWDDNTNVVLESHAVEMPGDPVILAAAEAIAGGGSTNLEQGLRTAYELARANYQPGRTNRVILISDGGANTGLTSEELIGGQADDADGEGIYLIAVGAASGGGFSDAFMDQVSDLGQGAYIYVDSEEEARRAFHGERFLQNLEIAARDVRLSVEFPEWTVVDEFHGEQISTNPEDVRPQHLSANDAMLYHMSIRTCSEDGLADDAVFRFRVGWRDRSTNEEHLTEIEATAAELLAGTNTQQAKADAIIAYAEGLQEMSTVENEDEYIASVLAKIDAAIEMRPYDQDLVEIRALFEQYTYGNL